RQPADHQGDFAVLAQARGEPQPGVLAATVPQAPPAAPAAQETGQAHAAAASAQETAESAESAIASVVTSGAVTAVVPPRTPEVPMEEEWEDTATQRFNELLAAHTARLARRD
ncbi:MAG: hypothetical protein FWF01_02765, partial [Alphaproteobacteria bacterium]|nr:hypothetical protein [Alphaproteobacteria bacterium]